MTFVLCHFSPFSGQITRNELHIVIGYKQSEFFRLVFDFAVNNENEAEKDLPWKGQEILSPKKRLLIFDIIRSQYAGRR